MVAHTMEKDQILHAFLHTKLLFRHMLHLSMHCLPQWAWQDVTRQLKPIPLPCLRQGLTHNILLLLLLFVPQSSISITLWTVFAE